MTDTGRQEAEIVRLVVHTSSEFVGRGPDSAWAQVRGDAVWVTLRRTLTRLEQTLVQHGESDVVWQARRAVTRLMQPILTAGVEEITGRKVVAFLSDQHMGHDIAVKVFLLEPRSTIGAG